MTAISAPEIVLIEYRLISVCVFALNLGHPGMLPKRESASLDLDEEIKYPEKQMPRIESMCSLTGATFGCILNEFLPYSRYLIMNRGCLFPLPIPVLLTRLIILFNSLPRTISQ